MKELFEAIGVLAETSLAFYRTVLAAGGSPEEAVTLTAALIKAWTIGNPNND